MAVFDNLQNDELERRDPAERERALMARLRSFVVEAKAASVHYAKTLASIDPTTLFSRDDLSNLPVLYKNDLIGLQESKLPFGGLATVDAGAVRRLFMSPGPIAEPQGRGGHGDHWRMARALRAADFVAGDRVLNCFSYHLTPAGFMLDEAIGAVGASVFPGGIGNTEAQAQAIQRFSLNGYTGTPDFLRIILERAVEMKINTGSMSKALVTGGPLFPQLRNWYGEHGVAVRQCYGSAELGLVAYEAASPVDGMVVDEDVIVEIVRPGTGEPVADGEVGEVVVTTFDPVYPLIRLATGDLSAVMTGPCPSGRTNTRLKGWMGRADQTTKVRGLFVHPRQVAAAISAYPQVRKARLTVGEADGKDQMTLQCEAATTSDDLAGKIEEALRIETRLRGAVEMVPLNSLPNDGKVIDDTRPATA